MENFLVNMAVIKVNWDRTGQAILDNYIPLVAYALKRYKHDVISLEDFRDEFRKVAEFEIPTAAVGTLLKRASRKYDFIKKDSHGTYKISCNSLPSSEYEAIRDEELRKYSGLRSSFVDFCKNRLNIIVLEEEADTYFFEILYEMAPSLFKAVSDIDDLALDKSHRRKYLVGRFVSHAQQSDQTSFKAIESFVRGAMLTETFYYSDPSDIQGKMKDVAVYFDTTFLLRALGLCEEKYSVPCRELMDILSAMSVRMWCFTQTYNEMHRVLSASLYEMIVFYWYR